MKSFKKFLEEVTIKGNPGVPGEGDKKPEDKDYLRDVESRAKNRLGISGREHPSQFGPRIMQLVGQSQQFTRGNENELEELAKEIILQNYGEILDGVELDIKLVRSGDDVAQFMQQCENEQDDDNQERPNFRLVKDPATINKIHKAKLGNNIIQGEAKNTKHIISTEEVKNGLIDIFGPNSERILNMWKEISNLADKMDWIIPIEVKADMMERAPQGMAGAVSIDWVPKENQEKEKAKESDKDFADRILRDLANGDEPSEEDKAELSEEIQDTTPRIRARGVDFPMLIHETIKGIYELIASHQFPSEGSSEEEVKMAQTVKLNVSSFEDEAEDFRTGPEIAADFRDFINQNPEAKHPNMRAFVFGKMMDSNYITDTEFLKLFRGILNKTSEARKKIDEIINEINKELNNYELGQFIDVEEPNYGFDNTDNYSDEEGDTLLPGKEEVEIPKEQSKVVYSELSQRELQDLIDDALDSGDYEKVKMLAQYMKEGKEVYLKEIERINESHIFHTRRK